MKRNIFKGIGLLTAFTVAFAGIRVTTHSAGTYSASVNTTILSLGSQSMAYCNSESADSNNARCSGEANYEGSRCWYTIDQTVKMNCWHP